MPKLYLAICFGIAVIGMLVGAKCLPVTPLTNRVAALGAASAVFVPFELTRAEQALRVRESHH